MFLFLVVYIPIIRRAQALCQLIFYFYIKKLEFLSTIVFTGVKERFKK